MLDEENLVARCQAGDERAFAELIDAYKSSVAGIVYRTMNRAEEVEDIAQEVFLRVFRSIGNFRGEAALSTWIHQIAYRVCLRELERHRRRGTHLPYDDDVAAAEVFRESTGPSHAEQFERFEAVKRWTEKLPINYRVALTLYYIQNKKYRDVAEIMDVPIGTVKTYLHRAKEHIRRQILDEGYENS